MGKVKDIQEKINRINMQLFELDCMEEWDPAHYSLYNSLVQDMKKQVTKLKKINEKKIKKQVVDNA